MMEFGPIYKKYEELLRMADDTFEKVKSRHPDKVRCETRCADCCHALFDLALVEALYLNHQFNRTFQGMEREKIIDRANKADRQTYKIKRNAYREVSEGRDEAEVIAALSAERVRCPLLNDDDLCDLYDHRPITCRFYGVPTEIGGKGHACGKSGFVPGEPYPTVKLEVIHQQLHAFSREIAGLLNSQFTRLSEMLVPVSMALLTTYDEQYLGVQSETGPEREEPAEDESSSSGEGR
jgi:Fe-S-cluster containining protein